MIESFTITNYLGESITLEMTRPETSGFAIKSVSGLGPPKANINMTDTSTDDGSLFNSARASNRNIVFELIFVDNDKRESIEELRHKTYKFFPLKKEVTIVVKTTNRMVQTVGYVESNEPNIFSSMEGAQISILCPNSYFYSVENFGMVNKRFSSVIPLFSFPFSNASLEERLISFGNIVVVPNEILSYDGEVETGVIIRMSAKGPVYNIKIHNATTRETMSINTAKLQEMLKSDIQAGDYITINTSKGSKSISLTREGTSINILNCLNKNTQWISLVKGNNEFSFEADNIENLIISIQNKIVYEGI